ncbi:helix-turn-helix domain-containing protein [Streptomyces yaizuensis]|uniref:Helix-turn-helix domain-containing protein n=1 Tax=Streptomyces yaizuensis TaxID=2989713 RepID=A0ABQ5PAX4_9ACTN|nr:helix-turn-helix transcriptional regulator [Streptomyces sp. YSPA8]GLF99749.1 helix-turn-helix domain-containing protein [Streptomyces sp. YSPA8]
MGTEVGEVVSTELARNVKKQRRAAGMTQEALAEAADLSVSTVQKVEQGGTARTQTLHAIARGLGVPTSRLFVADSPAPVVDDDATRRSLVPIRMALCPPVGLDGVLAGPGLVPDDPADVRRKVITVHDLYRADQFGEVAKALPGLLEETGAALSVAREGDERRAAMKVRSLALQVAGKYLTQVRQYDLAYHAVEEGIRLAREAGARRYVATGIIGLGWVLLRQDRFDECYRLAVTTAEQMEPRISEGDRARVQLWGELWMRAASAAARDNRPDDTRDARRMVARAAGGMDREDPSFPTTWGGFGPVTAEIRVIEDFLVQGDSHADARAVLSRSGEGVMAESALKRLGRPQGANWARHKLDVCRAHALLGAHQDAMDELIGIRSLYPEWIRHQALARGIMTDILGSRKRILTQEMRDMAAYLGVVE